MFCRPVRVHCVGVWCVAPSSDIEQTITSYTHRYSHRDTVSSVGIVRNKVLPGTADGMEHVCVFRHALALDERRVKFLPEYVNEGLSVRKSDNVPPTSNTPASPTAELSGRRPKQGTTAEPIEDSSHSAPAAKGMSADLVRPQTPIG